MALPLTVSAATTRRLAIAALSLGLLGSTSSCTLPDPPTITPPPANGQTGNTSVIEMTMPPPPTRDAVPVEIGATVEHVDAEGFFRIDVPQGWIENRQAPSEGTDIKVGTVFEATDGDGLLSITQFDNGRPPSGLGSTVNIVLRDVTGWMSQPGYQEVNRETVVERPGEAMRVEIVYSRSNGVLMHALALFQIDGTVFSMVNVSVEASSWSDNEALIRKVLRSYRVLGAGVSIMPTPEAGTTNSAADDAVVVPADAASPGLPAATDDAASEEGAATP